MQQGRGDQIREELRALGCEVNDREKVWRTTDGRRGRVGALAGGTIAIADDGQICQCTAAPTPARAFKSCTRATLHEWC